MGRKKTINWLIERCLNLPVIRIKIAQINRGIKTIKPPNVVPRRKSKTVFPTSIPAIEKQRKISMIPRIIIQIRGHRKCNPYLFKVIMFLGSFNSTVIFYLIDFKMNSIDVCLLLISSLTRKRNELQFCWFCYFNVLYKRRKKCTFENTL